MKFNKTLKELIMTLTTILIVACSFSKKASVDQNKISKISADNYIDKEYKVKMPAEEYASLQIQKLQQNNIIYFDLNKYNIHSDFTEILDTQANFLRSNPSYKITIEGHTDERGTPEYNISLGERRAKAIKIYLQSKGVSANQIYTISYGKEKPALLGHNEAVYAKNRRAVLVY